MKMCAGVLVLIFIILVNALCLSGQSFFIDGNVWRSLAGDDIAAKTWAQSGVIRGLSEALTLSVLSIREFSATQGSSMTFEEILGRLNESPYFCNLQDTTVHDVLQGVNLIYEDYANRSIPVFAVAHFVAKRIRGQVRDDEVPFELAKLRSTRWIK